MDYMSPLNRSGLILDLHHCSQAASARQEPAWGLPSGAGSAVGLQPSTSTLPSQVASSLERWRWGPTHTAASTRSHCYIQEEEVEEEEEKEEGRAQKASVLRVYFQAWAHLSVNGLVNVYEVPLFLLRRTREKGWPLGAAGAGLLPPQMLLAGTEKLPLFPNPSPWTL